MHTLYFDIVMAHTYTKHTINEQRTYTLWSMIMLMHTHTTNGLNKRDAKLIGCLAFRCIVYVKYVLVTFGLSDELKM